MSYTYESYTNELQQTFDIETLYHEEQNRYRANAYYIEPGTRSPGTHVLQMMIDQGGARITFQSDKFPELSFDSLITHMRGY